MKENTYGKCVIVNSKEDVKEKTLWDLKTVMNTLIRSLLSPKLHIMRQEIVIFTITAMRTLNLTPQ
jgi:hypothetical protein